MEEDVLPEDYGQKDYSEDFYVYTVCQRRQGPGDAGAMARASKRITLWKKREKIREAQRLKDENDARERNARLIQEVKNSMPDVYGNEEYEADSSELETLYYDESADRIDFLKIRMGIFEAKKEKERQETIKKAERIKQENEAKEKKKLVAKIRAKNKRIKAYNAKQREKNGEIRNAINEFIETINHDELVSEYRDLLGDIDCKNPEFVRGFLSAIDKIVSFNLGERPYLEYKPYEPEP